MAEWGRGRSLLEAEPDPSSQPARGNSAAIPNQSILQELLSMGYEESIVKAAATKTSDLNVAIDWIIDNSETFYDAMDVVPIINSAADGDGDDNNHQAIPPTEDNTQHDEENQAASPNNNDDDDTNHDDDFNPPPRRILTDDEIKEQQLRFTFHPTPSSYH